MKHFVPKIQLNENINIKLYIVFAYVSKHCSYFGTKNWIRPLLRVGGGGKLFEKSPFNKLYFCMIRVRKFCGSMLYASGDDKIRTTCSGPWVWVVIDLMNYIDLKKKCNVLKKKFKTKSPTKTLFMIFFLQLYCFKEYFNVEIIRCVEANV